MAPEFHVQPDGLDTLAADFRSAGQRLADRIGGFSGQAFAIGEAFGLLGACSGVTEKYADMVAHTGEGLGRLAELLQSTGDALKHSSEQYRGTDGSVARTMEV
jgi:uncharacterized protein YukE